MGVAAVTLNGQETPINHSTAKDIYKAYQKGEVELTPAQQKYTESLLSPKDLDEVKYDMKGEDAQKSGYNEIEDAKKADSHDGQGANAAVTTIGNIAGVVGSCMAASALANATDGFTQAALSGGMLAGAGVSLASVIKFDNAYSDRTQACDNADGTNEIIDSYSAALIDTMDMMNEDMASYLEQSDELTLGVNTNTSMIADLQIQLADAQAAGDKAGVENIKNQMKQLQGADFSQQEESLQETSGRLEEYKAANDESIGVREGGQTVSDFLKEGTPLGVVGVINSAALLVGSTIMGITAATTTPKLAPFFPDAVGTIAGKVLFALTSALFGTAATIMGTKTKNEFECGSAGGDMQDHVNDLNEMIDEQLSYTDQTTENYAVIDEDSAESQADAKDKANKAVANNSPAPPKKDDDSKGGDKVGAGAGAGTGNA